MLEHAVLSYSAGTTGLDPDAYRVCRSNDDRLVNVVRVFPELGPMLEGARLMVISCYPATLGAFRGTIFVDTYLKWETFARAMLLANREGWTPLILGQPMFLLDALARYHREELPLPPRALACVGGYTCPLSLERTLVTEAHKSGGVLRVLHSYGVAEVDAACLVGVTRTRDGDVIYKSVLPHVVSSIRAGRLFLNAVDTGDFAERAADDAFLIRNAPDRLGEQTRLLLESWSETEWLRRTGHVGRVGSERVYQLRAGLRDARANERRYFEFQESFRGSWLDKPDWH